MLFRSGNRKFVRNTEWFLSENTGEMRSVGGSSADFDGDGDFDLLVLTAYGTNHLLLNTGQGFENVSTEKGISTEIGDHTFASWYDFDLDGDLDLYIGGHKEQPYTGDFEFQAPYPNRLYRNDNGYFEMIPLPKATQKHDDENVDLCAYLTFSRATQGNKNIISKPMTHRKMPSSPSFWNRRNNKWKIEIRTNAVSQE